jgi:hypothetical protein
MILKELENRIKVNPRFVCGTGRKYLMLKVLLPIGCRCEIKAVNLIDWVFVALFLHKKITFRRWVVKIKG